jgi:hypothetical protein
VTSTDRATATEVLNYVVDRISLRELIEYVSREGFYCCPLGCGEGACEACPCCSAGWCVSGTDGLPDNPDDLAQWLEVAAEHNPVAAALAAERAAVADLRTRVEAVAEEMDGVARVTGGWINGSSFADSLRAAVTDTTGDPA